MLNIVKLIAGPILVLLFEPRRLAERDASIDPKSATLMEAIPHLLTVVRNIAERSEFVKQLVSRTSGRSITNNLTASEAH